ncbi:MAG: DUF5681 domain-containing protein [Roseiarcus sp.]
MTDDRKPYEVGYKNPPKHTRWKKGQCGNPQRRRKRAAAPGTVELIDAALNQRIPIRENGTTRRVSVFEAILLQLFRKEMAGDRRAARVRLLYQEFVEAVCGPPERSFIVKHRPRATN